MVGTMEEKTSETEERFGLGKANKHPCHVPADIISDPNHDINLDRDPVTVFDCLLQNLIGKSKSTLCL
jgi:hypothetical protein